jgi:hypothetical protein
MWGQEQNTGFHMEQPHSSWIHDHQIKADGAKTSKE